MNEEHKSVVGLEEHLDEFSSLVRVILDDYVTSYYDIHDMASTLKQIISTEADIRNCLFKKGYKR